MTPAELLAELDTRGVSITDDGDRLRVNAPKGALTDELRAALAEHKTAMLYVAQQRRLEASILNLLNEADVADNPHDLDWARRWAELMIATRTPRYPDGRTNTGAAGWRAWLQEAMDQARAAADAVEIPYGCKWCKVHYATCPKDTPECRRCGSKRLVRDRAGWWRRECSHSYIRDADLMHARPISKGVVETQTNTHTDTQSPIEPPEAHTHQERTDEMGTKVKMTVPDPIPTGEYPAIISAVEDADGQYGPQFKFKFELLSPDDLAGRALTGWCSAKLAPKSKLHKWTSAALFAGGEVPIDYELDIDQLLGETVRVVVVVKPGKDGGEFSHVENVKPLLRKPAGRPVAITAQPQTVQAPTVAVAEPPDDETPDASEEVEIEAY